MAERLNVNGQNLQFHLACFNFGQVKNVIDVALETKPDLIILDILLPDLPGWEVLIELKANPVTQNIPVLIISVVDDRPKGLA